MRKILILSVACLPLFSLSQGFQVSLQGQKQQAMAGAGTAYIQDGAALYYNPGAVSFLSSNSASIGATAAISNSKFADKNSAQQAETQSPVAFPFTAYFVLGKKESKLKYGLAVYTPFGSGVKWQDGWTGRFTLTQAELAAIYFQPTVSYQISKQLGVGAGFVYSTGKVNFQKDIPVMNNNGEYGHAELNGTGSGTGFNAGLYYKPTTKLFFGLTYKSQVRMQVDKGEVRFDVPASLAASFPNGNFSTSVTLPAIMTFGIGVQATKQLAFAFDASKIYWNCFDTLMFDYEKNTPQLTDTKSARNYKDAYSFRLGAQYTLNKKLDARAGIKYLGSPVQDGFLTADIPDASHLNYSFGLGYKLSNRFIVDGSLTIQNMDREGGEDESGLQGRYKTNIIMPGISLHYNF